LIIDQCFSDKELDVFILEGRKENVMGTVTQKIIKKEDHCMRECVLFKEWLQKKRILGY
jgi:hypothetical protein